MDNEIIINEEATEEVKQLIDDLTKKILEMIEENQLSSSFFMKKNKF